MTVATNRLLMKLLAAVTLFTLVMSMSPVTAFANDPAPVDDASSVSTDANPTDPSDAEKDKKEKEEKKEEKKQNEETPNSSTFIADPDQSNDTSKLKDDQQQDAPQSNNLQGEVQGLFFPPFPPIFDEDDFPGFDSDFCLTIELFQTYIAQNYPLASEWIDIIYDILCDGIDFPEGDDVTICHATPSEANPYNKQTVSVFSIVKKNGHGTHEGDIIPPFSYIDKDDNPQQYLGLNWPAGEATLNNNCVPPETPQPKQCFLFSDEDTLANGNASALTWVHPNWGDELAGGSAEWIWSTATVTNPTVSEVVTFTKTFTADAAGTATLKIAADNSYTVSLNGTPSCNGTGNANFSNPMDTCSVNIVSGSNTLTIVVTNEATPSDSNPENNPAGLIYEIVSDQMNCTPTVPQPEEDTATIIATKLVCTNEADLPNWGTGGADITATTAADWIVNHPSCALVSGWEFEWANADVADPRDGDDTGTAGAGWTAFGPTDANGVATVELAEDDIDGDAHVWVREILKPDYLGFSWYGAQDNSNNVSAEMYCSSDVLNYDNWERIDGIEVDETYHCVAWNVPTTQTPTETQTSETIVVRAADLALNIGDVIASSTKWFFYNDRTGSVDGVEGINNAVGSFVFGPETAPIGDGSAQITALNEPTCPSGGDTCVRRNIATYQFKDVKLADIKTLSYSTYSQSAGNGSPASERSAYLQFNVDFDNSDTWQRRLIHLPSINGVVTNDDWQTWDAIDGGNALWLYSGATWPGTGDAGTSPKTWNQIKALYPNAETRSTDSWFGFRIGEPYSNGFTGNVDNFKIGIKTGSNTHTKTFDFEPTEPSEPSVTVSASKVVCDAEAYLPNGQVSKVSGYISASTAQDWVDQSDGHCELASGWEFEWGAAGAGDEGPATIGYAANNYTNFGPTDVNGVATVSIPLADLNGRIEMREVLKENYIPFTNGGSESAELICANDGGNYDNWEWINNPQEGSTYHCVAFNVPTAEPTSDITMCKLDEEGDYLPGWTLTLLGESVGDVDVLPNGGTYSVLNVPAGDYVLKATGSYTYRADAVASTSDATYSYRLSSDAVYGGPDVPWVNVNTFPNPHTGWLGVMFNAAFTNWGSDFNPAHVYVHGTSTAAAQDFNFQILDDQYGDNSGSINVEVFEGYAGVTDEEGCVIFNDVPFGTYTAGEIMQEGWEEGEDTDAGEIVVNEETETINIVNDTEGDEPALCTIEIESDESNMVDGDNAVFVSFIHEAWDALIGGVDWIWSTDPVATPSEEITETFTKTFEWDGVIDEDTETTLTIAADNSYKVWLNGTDVSDLIGEDAAENNFGSTDVYTDFEDLLVSGTNTLTIEVKNHALSNGTTESNPAGLLYKLAVTGENADCENDQDESDGDGDGNNGGDNQKTLSITFSGEGEGLVTGDGINCHSSNVEFNDCSETYPTDEDVALLVTPDAGSNFDNSWHGDSAGTCTGNAASCNIPMDIDRDLVANFGLNTGGDFVTSSGGSNGSSRRISNDEDGEVAGAQTSIMPIGAPNTGAGGAAGTIPTSSVAFLLISAVALVAARLLKTNEG